MFAPVFSPQVLRSLPASSLGAISVVRSAGAMLSARHGAERLLGCWNGGALSLEQVRERIKVRGSRGRCRLWLRLAVDCREVPSLPSLILRARIKGTSLKMRARIKDA